MKHPSLDPANPSEDVAMLVHKPSPTHADNLVTDSIFEQTEEIAVYLEEAYPEKEKLNSFLSPWGLGSILLLILANGLLTWGQWSGTQASKPEPSPVSVENIPDSAPKRENSLSLNSLSTLILPTVKPSVPSITPRVQTPTKPVVKTTQTQNGNLTEALLPPSVQPQLMPTYTVAPTVTPSDSHQSSTVTPPPPPQPVAPTVKPSPELSPSATLETADNNQPTLSKPLQALTNEQMLEQLRQREEAPSSLSFQQRTRARLEAAQTGQNANELMQRQIQQQQQQQQSVPSSIIIDKSGTSINY